MTGLQQKSKKCYLWQILNFHPSNTKEPKIVIPDFQRAYCWNLLDINKILDDVDSLRLHFDTVQNQSSDQENSYPYYSDTDYFLGSICFHQKNNLSSYELLDGQQRITSFLILTSVLLELAKESDDSKIQEMGKRIREKLSPNHQDEVNAWEKTFHYEQEETRKHIQHIRNEIKAQYLSLKNLTSYLEEQGKASKEKSLYNNALKKDLLRLYYILEHGFLSVTVIKSLRSAEQFFQGENNRGVPMTMMDILKSYHLRQIHNFVTKDKDQENQEEKALKIWSYYSAKEEIIKNVALAALLMPFGIPYGESDSSANIDRLKGLLGTTQNLLVDKKVSNRGIKEAVANENYLYDLTDPMIPGIDFFNKLSQYTQIAQSVESIAEDLLNIKDKIHEKKKSFTCAKELLMLGLIAWCDRFIEAAVANFHTGQEKENEENLSKYLNHNLEFLTYGLLITRFFNRLPWYPKSDSGVYGAIRFESVLRLLRWRTPETALFLMPYRTSSPAFCRQAFEHEIAPEVMSKRVPYPKGYIKACELELQL